MPGAGHSHRLTDYPKATSVDQQGQRLLDAVKCRRRGVERDVDGVERRAAPCVVQHDHAGPDEHRHDNDEDTDRSSSRSQSRHPHPHAPIPTDAIVPARTGQLMPASAGSVRITDTRADRRWIQEVAVARSPSEPLRRQRN